jgi:hypothetical protein
LPFDLYHGMVDTTYSTTHVNVIGVLPNTQRMVELLVFIYTLYSGVLPTGVLGVLRTRAPVRRTEYSVLRVVVLATLLRKNASTPEFGNKKCFNNKNIYIYTIKCLRRVEGTFMLVIQSELLEYNSGV